MIEDEAFCPDCRSLDLLTGSSRYEKRQLASLLGGGNRFEARSALAIHVYRQQPFARPKRRYINAAPSRSKRAANHA
jgi:hypothetical protein